MFQVSVGFLTKKFSLAFNSGAIVVVQMELGRVASLV